jgi:DNA-binding NtrC family response regulator
LRHLARRAVGGTVSSSDVADMSPILQELLVELLRRWSLILASARSSAVRLVSGATVSLPDPIAAGIFSERLFHRLNLIHLRTPTTQKPARLRSSEDDNAPPSVLLWHRQGVIIERL